MGQKKATGVGIEYSLNCAISGFARRARHLLSAASAGEIATKSALENCQALPPSSEILAR